MTMRGGGRFRLGVCVIARDEATTIGACLRSVGGIADDIVVVDTGSRDETAVIAARSGARVVRFEWTDDFAAARNRALEEIRGEWVLSLDADEVLPAPTAVRLPATLAQCDAPALRVPVENVSATGGLGSVEPAVRLFRPEAGARWRGLVHERIETRQVGDAWLPIVHHGWAEPAVRIRKLRRDVALLERALATSPDDTFVLARLADARLGLGEPEVALAIAERALALPDTTGEVGLRLLDTLAHARAAAGRPEAAADVCRIALALRPEWIDPRLLLGRLAYRAGRPREAAVHLDRWLADRTRLAGDPAWPARLPRLRTLGAEAAVRAELAMVAAGLGELERGRPQGQPTRFTPFAPGVQRFGPAGPRGLA